MASRTNPKGTAEPARLFIVGTFDDFITVTEGYRLDPYRVFRYDDLEEATIEALQNRAIGAATYVITVGPDARDLLRLKRESGKAAAIADTRTGDGTVDTDKLFDRMIRREIPIREGGVPDRLTWSMLVKREPRLADLRAVVDAVVDSDENAYDSREVWYHPHNVNGLPGIKEQMSRLVGYHALTDDPALRSSEAYEIAYQALYDPLPVDRDRDDDSAAEDWN